MSTAQIVFNTDSALKAQVMQKVKASGLTLKAVFNQMMKLYASGKIDFELALVKPKYFDQVEESDRDYQAWKQAEADRKQGVNVYDGDKLFAELNI